MPRLALVLRSLCLLVLAIAALSLPSALAEDTARERIFLVFHGEEASALEAESLKFQAPVLEANQFEFAGTQEMEVLYASCEEDIGTNAASRRDCQLRAANRISVTQVLQLTGSKLDKKTWDVSLEVWSPATNGLLWGATLEVESSSLRRAAREAYPELANRYLCWRGVESACPSSAPAAVAEASDTTTTTTATTPPVESPPAGEASDGMVLVPAGKFTKGSTQAQFDAALATCESERGEVACMARPFQEDDEKPQEVDVDAFYIDLYEVTVDDYAKCVDAGICTEPYIVESCWGGDTYKNRDESDRGSHPVNCVAWHQAQDYCDWAGKRLPTELEWEKAARGTDGRIYPWGDAHPSKTGSMVGNFADDPRDWNWVVADYDDGYTGTSPVGSYPAGKSPYGVHDMAGNVWEWTSTETSSGSERVVRGGCFSGDAASVRIAFRGHFTPSYAGAALGFRCARSSP